ncbi:hypothetical protein [Streptomyces sp. NPDC086023]|uniref:hypothetical protein n=1 Tax=Streptomyces sp. NPDC086023 TaxID=3365746 RepID=UPI0037D49CC7
MFEYEIAGLRRAELLREAEEYRRVRQAEEHRRAGRGKAARTAAKAEAARQRFTRAA